MILIYLGTVNTATCAMVKLRVYINQLVLLQSQ